MEETTVTKDCLYAVFIFPLTAGNTQQGKLHPDGTISAVVTGIVWLAVMYVLTEGGIWHTVTTGITLNELVHFVISVNIMLGLIGCYFIAVNTRLRGIDSLARFHGSCGARKIRIGFLWFFSIGTIIYCLETICRDTICIIIKYGVSKWNIIDNVADALYNISLCVFTVTQSSILHYFASYKFKHITKIHFCMMLMIGANLSVWFHSHHTAGDSAGNNSSDSLGTYDCFTNGSYRMFIMNRIYYKSTSIFRPNILEFTILSTCLILEMWSPLRKSSSCQNLAMEENGLMHVADETDNYIYNHEYTHLLNNGAVISPLTDFNSFSNDRSLLSGTSSRLHCSFFVAVFVGVIIVLPPTVMNILAITIYRNDTTFHTVYRIYYYVVHNAIVFVFMYYGFFTLKRFMKPVNSKRGFKVREMVMLGTVFFVFQFDVYMIFAGIYDHSLISKMVSSFFSISTEYLQIVFILQARRFEPKEFSSRRVVFEGMIVVMAIISLAGWAANSFIGTAHGYYTDTMKAVGEESWKRIEYVIYPVLVFYRFHIFFCYYSLYKMFVR